MVRAIDQPSVSDDVSQKEYVRSRDRSIGTYELARSRGHLAVRGDSYSPPHATLQEPWGAGNPPQAAPPGSPHPIDRGTSMMPRLSASECPILMRRLVGSHAYGLDRPDSDVDYREVFMYPTNTLLGYYPLPKDGWQDDTKHTDDEGGWEVKKWLVMVQKGSPNAVELIFASEAAGEDEWAETRDYEFGGIHMIEVDGVEVSDRELTRRELCEVARGLLSTPDIRRAYVGYANNSFRKIPEKPTKWMTGYLRSLWQGRELLRTGVLPMVIPNEDSGDSYAISVHEANQGKLTAGQVLDIGQGLEYEVKTIDSVLSDSPNIERANEWLTQLRTNRIT